MENFIFALNSTIPVFLVILLGWFLKKVGILNEAFNKAANTYVFKCALPISLFRSIAGMDLYGEFDWRFCVYCFAVTTIMFLGGWGLTWLFMKDKRQVGAFAQASARSSAAILGVAFAVNIYGNSGMVPMMIMAAVPFFNIYAVMILSFSPHVDEEGNLIVEKGNTNAIKKACLDVLKNPIILGILAGMPFTLLQWKVPTMLDSALSMVGGTASPVALLVVGASFSGVAAKSRLKSALVSSFVKLWLLPLIFLPLAALMGFRNSEMVAILIMVGSPTTVASFVMAKTMKADSVLTSNAILISTILSAVSITFWIYMLRVFSLI